MKNDELLNMAVKSKLYSALSSRKKASRNRFINLLDYSMLSTTVAPKAVVLIVQNPEYDDSRLELGENVFEGVEKYGNDNGSLREAYSIELSYSSILCEKCLNEIGQAELFMLFKIASSIFAKILSKNTCQGPETDESVIAIVAKLDAWT